MAPEQDSDTIAISRRQLCGKCRNLDLGRAREPGGQCLPGKRYPLTDFLDGAPRCPLCLFFEACSRDMFRNPSERITAFIVLAPGRHINDHPESWRTVTQRGTISCFREGPDPDTPSTLYAKVRPRYLRDDGVDEDVLKKWLGFCDTVHPLHCRTGNRPALPRLRVIDCYKRRIVSFSAAMGEYVTLSYVWGTTTNTYPVSYPAVSHHVPKVVADAMYMTLRLGFRYLWIDRYCIPHDDEQERHSQIRNMDTVYAASTLTLIAAAGNGPEDGLAGVDGSPRRQQLRLRVDKYILTYLRDFKAEFQASTWSSGGWTYQEGLLAKRRLVFGESEAYFECSSMHCFESISIPLTDVHDSRGVMYSLPGDSVSPATTHLALALNWSVTGLNNKPLPVSRRRAFPSWTWTGWKRDTEPHTSMMYWHMGFAVLPSVLFGYKTGRNGRRVKYRFPLHIEIELDGMLWDWDEDHDTVLGQSETGVETPRLWLQGWTFALRQGGATPSYPAAVPPDFPWKVALDPDMGSMQRYDPGPTDIGYDPTWQSFLGFVLYTRHEVSEADDSYPAGVRPHEITALVLTPGRVGTFERVGLLRFMPNNDGYPKPSDTTEVLLENASHGKGSNRNVRLNGVGLYWRQICLV
ncbi:heterokaryon incompatibility protein-domain-containing protein [Podospora aff. communis PSN243]|uniref:Heterokaryon incompatibility protein-domain-containing protein n=1 Tax=Podospora aff. communis PSN243 TaxID=3040156 RepID=A0AAV9G6I7_9PEZI|nr:heterokaryon incompatibility protein-domain-containing protein [Podospora aff. communis PSN243]